MLTRLLLLVLLGALMLCAAGCSSSIHYRASLMNAQRNFDQGDLTAARKYLLYAERYKDPAQPSQQAQIDFMRGKILDAEGHRAEAVAAYEFVVNRFPETDYAARAKFQLEHLCIAQAAAEGAEDLFEGCNAVLHIALLELLNSSKNVQNEKGPIVFKTGTAELDAAKCEETLRSIDGLIKRATGLRLGLKVQIGVHTDSNGNRGRNLRLSQERAEAVAAWLTAHLQTPADGMTAKGFGDSEPVADSETEAGRAKNRRVDFRVIPGP